MAGKLISVFAIAIAASMSCTTGASAANSPARTQFAQITPLQQKMIEERSNPENAPAEVRPIAKEAAHEIKALLEVASCRANYDPQFLNRPAERRTPYNDGGAMTELPSHQHRDKGCLTVDKVHDWRLLSQDAFAFEVIYKSGDGLETIAKNYSVAKRGNEWRIRYWTKPDDATKR